MSTVKIDKATLQALYDDLEAVKATLSGLAGHFLHLADVDYIGQRAQWVDEAARLDDVTHLLIHTAGDLRVTGQVGVYPSWQPADRRDGQARGAAARQHVADRRADLDDQLRDAVARWAAVAEVAS